MNKLENKYQPSIAIVFGYILNIDKRPKIAFDNKLNERFSIAFDTYNPEIRDMYFDIMMFKNIFTRLISEIEFDRVAISFGQEEQDFKTFVDLLELIKERNAPFNRIIIYNKKRIVCYIETEFYNSIGGPYPYHDTYNFAIFLNEIKQDKFNIILNEVCETYNYVIRTIEYGLKEPKTTIFYHLKNFL